MLTCAVNFPEGNFLQVYFLHIIPSQGTSGKEKLPTGYPISNPLGLIFITVSSSYYQPLNVFYHYLASTLQISIISYKVMFQSPLLAPAGLETEGISFRQIAQVPGKIQYGNKKNAFSKKQCMHFNLIQSFNKHLQSLICVRALGNSSEQNRCKLCSPTNSTT